MTPNGRERTSLVVIELLTLTLVFLPVLLYGGNSEYFRAIFGFIGIILLGLVFYERWRKGPARPVTRKKLPYPEPWLVLALWAAFCLIHIIQLLPLPSLLVRLLAGWQPESSWARLTPYPEATMRALIYWLPAFAVFAAITLTYDKRAMVRRLLGGIFILATATSVYGIFQTVSGNEMIWGLAKRAYQGCVTGTFVNRNHFAAFVTLGVGAGLGLGLYRGAKLGTKVRQTGSIERLLLFGFAAVLCLAGIVLSYSRGGLGSVVLVGFPMAMWLIGRRRLSFLLMMAMLLLGTLAVSYWIARQPVTNRFAQLPEEARTEDARPAAWATSLRAAGGCLLFGSGAGTFEDHFRLIPDTGILVRYNHAHSDPLELLVETGLVGLLALYGGILLALIVSLRALANRHSRFARMLSIGAIAGVAAVLFHSLFDFPLHVIGVRLPLFAMLGVAYLVAHRRLTR